MKTKIILFLCLIINFGITKVLAQPPVIKETISVPVEGIYIPCTDDYCSGTLTMENKIMPHLVWMKIHKVELQGESGKVYTISQIYKGNFLNPFKGNVLRDNNMGQIWLEGKLIANVRFKYHITYNANGDVTVEFSDLVYDCL